MKVLVTGATGLVGTHVARCLRARGHAVRVLARDPEKARRWLAQEATEIASGDMTDRAAVRAALCGCDAVVHAAAAVSLDPRDAEEMLRANVAGAREVVGGAIELGIRRIVYLSSLTTIWRLPGPDPAIDSPLREGQRGYARAKVEAERVVRSLDASGAAIAIVYPNGVIGPDDPGRSEAVRAFRGFTRTSLATSGGLASVDVRDLALFCVRLLEEGCAGRYVVGGQFQPWDELVASLEPLLGRKIARLRAPGWLLRAAGSALDALRLLRPVASPISREAMEYATRMRALPNDPALAALGVTLRPLAHTYRDTLQSLEARKSRVRHAPLEQSDKPRSPSQARR